MKFKQLSIYNTPEAQEHEDVNYIKEIIVEWNDDDCEDTFTMEITTEIDEYQDGKIESVDVVKTKKTFEATPEWVIMLESPEIYYAAFHALSVGYDGSHLNYMIINKPEIIEK